MKPKNDQKICVAYPHPSDVAARFHRSMVNMLVFDMKGSRLPDGRKIGGRQRIVDGGAIIDMASGAQITKTRNRIVRDFLALDGIDWLLMVDADMTFTPDLAEMLVEAAHPVERPVVGGLCFAYMLDQSRKFWPTLYAYMPDTNLLRRLVRYPDNTLIPVAATGAACLLVHRSVLEKMGERFPAPWPWFAETPFCQTDSDGNTIPGTEDAYSEDITFCLRAQAAGFPVFVHTGIKLGHVKTFEADETAFIAESEALAEACVPVLPTFAVIASKNRPEMLANLRAQLAGQCTDTFVYDNGYDESPPDSIPAHGWPLHRMWNDGLDRARAATPGMGPHNVIVINDDVEVPNEFAVNLEAALRVADDHWIAYPNHAGLRLPECGWAAITASRGLAGQTMSGWAFMLRGEEWLAFDEQFEFWYGDSDLERQVRERGKKVVCVDVEARHLDPMRSTMTDPVRLAQAEADETRFAAKWGLDPWSLWLSQNRVSK